MQTKLIQTKDYLLLIDEEVICKTGELYLTSIQNRIIPKSKGVIQAGDKIIAYRKLNSKAKELEGLPLLPPFEEVNLDLLADKTIEGYNDLMEKENWIPLKLKYEEVKQGFKLGYKSAQPKQFNLEDMKKAFEYGKSLEPFDSFEDFIQSLSTQQLPKEFIPEYEVVKDSNNYGDGEIFHNNMKEVLKTITNSQGKQELVGKYIYTKKL